MGSDSKPAALPGEPLSYQQYRLWMTDRLNPESGVAESGIFVILRGPLDRAALQLALDDLVARHQALRLRFAFDGRVVRQWEGPAYSCALTLVETPKPNSWDLEIARAHRTVLLLEGGNVARAWLFRVSAEEHRLHLRTHHAAFDGHSVMLVVEDLATAYEARRQGKAPAWSAPGGCYLDYARRQAASSNPAQVSALRAYWRDRLAGFAAISNDGAPTLRQGEANYETAAVSFTLPAPQRRRLKDRATEAGATEFMIYLAACHLLAMRQSGRWDSVIGAAKVDRQHPADRQTVGCFISLLPLRATTDPGERFTDWLRRQRPLWLADYAHLAVPLEMLSAGDPEASGSRQEPLFDLAINMQLIGHPTRMAAELAIDHLPLPHPFSAMPSTLYIDDMGTGDLIFRLNYRKTLFPRERKEEWLRQLAHLLNQIADDPARQIADYDLLTDAARATLPDPTRPLPFDWPGPMTERLTAVAQSQPEATAMIDDRGAYSYADLEAASNRLAQELRRQGIGRGSLVAIFGQRNAGLPVALMGTIKAGAAVVPLDPVHPDLFLAEMLEPIELAALLIVEGARAPSGELAARLAALPQIVVERPTNAAVAPCPAPEIELGYDDIYGLVFTSGSSGRSRAVRQNHGHMTATIGWYGSEWRLAPGDRLSLLFGLGHDPLSREIMAAFWYGAMLCIPDPARLFEPGWLARWVGEQRIDILHATPAIARLLQQPDLAPYSHLRMAALVGEALTRRDAAALRRRAPQAAIVNYFSTSEMGRVMGSHRLRSEDEREDGPPLIPIGPGWAAAQLLVVREDGSRAGIDEIGEIWARSPHLAAGYLNDPEANAERYLTNPFVAEPDARDRIYRTGDLGRFRPDGTIEPLGRRDRQIKIRGIRIDLAQIQAALKSHPDLGDAAIIARASGGEQDGLTLVAYVVPMEGRNPDSGSLRRYLRERLPAPALPHHFVTLERLPLTANGKIDERALPAPRLDPGAADAAPTPMTADEATVAALMAETLGLESVGRDADFFALGGDSIGLVAVLTEIERIAGQRIVGSDLLNDASPAKIAEMMAAGQLGAERRILVPIRNNGKGAPVIFVHGAGGEVIFAKNLANAMSDRWPIFGIRSLALIEPGAFPSDLRALARRYVEDLRRTLPRGPYHLCGICAGGVVALEMAVQLRAAGESVAFLGLVDSPLPARPGHARSLAYQWRIIRSLSPLQLPRYLVAALRPIFRSPAATARLTRLQGNPASPGQAPTTFMAAALGYRPESYDQPAWLFTSKQFVKNFGEPSLGWHSVFDRRLKIACIGETHAGLFRPESASTLAAAVERAIAEAEETVAPGAPHLSAA